MDDRTQESKKTVVAFVVGLLIGGLLVWVFGSTGSSSTENGLTRKDNTIEEKTEGSANDKKEVDKKTNTDTDMAGAGQNTGPFVVANQSAGMKVSLGDVQYPSEEGWIVVHDDIDGELGWALGAARYHTGVGLLPKEVDLLRATEKGKTYRVVFYTQEGGLEFDLKIDTPMEKDGKLLQATFVAQ
ncbi:hypothetical protein HY416_01670 [Candidatus Kaiserbacteria bacterium]|nr:hypothetical protein [Candidatus Kaiserbacteria bacterium]